MILFFVALLMFSVPISMLNLNRTSENYLVASYFGNWVTDGIFNQYMLSLGEFGDLTNIDSENLTLETWVIMIFFLMATFFTQITMLNMLIAIMSDSFDRSMENKKRFGIKTKLDILISYLSVLPKK